MRAFRPLIIASGILATGMVISSSAAHAAVRVYVTAGPSAPPYYAQRGSASPYPGYSWIPAYYDAYRNYYPGRWVALQGWRDHEWREHRGWDRDQQEQGNWYRYGRRDHDEDEDR